jgi:hypothetical protein
MTRCTMRQARCFAVAALVLAAATASAAAQQRCPPNSHSKPVAFVGNLRTAQCFCDAGYRPVGGACARIQSRAARTPSDPAKMLVQPR